MTSADLNISLQPIAPADQATLANLMELYCHDLSAVFGLHIGADGRFGYPQLTRFCGAQEGCLGFFIRANEQLAGFVLATHGSPAIPQPSATRPVLDVAEFFVLRTHRQQGVGSRAAALLWKQLPGHWVIRVAVDNTPAIPFWRNTIQSYAGTAYSERVALQGGRQRHIFQFDAAE